MARLRFTPAAHRDLDEIVALHRRARFCRGRPLDGPNRRPMLAARSASGSWAAATGFVAGHSILPTWRYLIFYREGDAGSEVLRLLHGARDYGPREF